MSGSASERSLHACIAAYASWAQTPDPTARTVPARAGLDARFEHKADPHGVLPPAERERRASALRKAHFARLGLRSAQARRKAREARESAAALDVAADTAETDLKTERLAAAIRREVESAPR